jgi:DnaJ-class molecular chaperone
MDSEDYYAILGLEKNATADQIKKNYRKLAGKWHPDLHPTDKEKAAAMFAKIGEASEVLSDPEKRKLYDQFGKDGMTGGMNSNSMNNPFGATDLSDLFSSFSSSFSMPLMYTIELSLEDLYIGRELNVAVNNQQILINIDSTD